MILGKPSDRFSAVMVGTVLVSWALVLIPQPAGLVLTIFAVICLGLFGSELLAWINAGSPDEPTDDSGPGFGGPSDDDLKIP